MLESGTEEERLSYFAGDWRKNPRGNSLVLWAPARTWLTQGKGAGWKPRSPPSSPCYSNSAVWLYSSVRDREVFLWRGNLPMALPQFKCGRIKFFSPEAIFLNSKEPDCAETENIFAFKPKQGYFFPETQASVILLCSERLILQAVKKRLLDNLGARGHKAILCPTQCTETSCLSAGSCWKQLCCSRWSLWPNQLRSSWWDFKCSLFAERIHRIFWGRSWEEQRNDTAKANCVVMAVLKGQHLLQCKQSIWVEGGGLGVVRHEILPKWEGRKKRSIHGGQGNWAKAV